MNIQTQGLDMLRPRAHWRHQGASGRVFGIDEGSVMVFGVVTPRSQLQVHRSLILDHFHHHHHLGHHHFYYCHPRSQGY